MEVVLSDSRWYTLCVWSVFHSRWVPLITTQRDEWLELFGAHFANVVFVPHAIVMPTGGSDDEVMAAVSALTAPEGFDLEGSFRELADSLEVGRFHDAVHPPGDPNR